MGTAARSAPLRRAGSLLALLGLELGAVLALHWLGRFPGLRIRWDEPVPWVLSSPVQEVVGAVLRTVGLVMAYWLLASTVLYLLASLTRLPSAVRAVGWATLPLARRVADRAVAVTLATSMVGGSTLGWAGPALAADRGGAGPPARKPVAAAQAATASGQQDPPPSSADQPPYVPEPADEVPTSGSGTTAPPTTAPEATGPPSTPYVPEPADQAPLRLPAPGQPPTTKAPTTTTEATTTSEAPATTKAPTTTTTEAPATTEVPATEAPATTEAPASTAAAPTTQATAPPTTSAPGATRQGVAAPTTTHAYEFNPATTGPSAAPREPGQPGSGSSGGSGGPSGGSGGSGGGSGGSGGGSGGSGGGTTRSDEQEPYQVASGDNLWAIARDHLAKARSGGSGEPTNREVADYWMRVVEANLDTLQSGDPDLIYPGEEITLPPVG